jgi:putative hydrolase of the HAD superfamily
MIKYISFDLDGTLADASFDRFIWHEEIPKLYAAKHGMTIENAKLHVYADYYLALYIERVENWYDIAFWFNRLGLHGWRQLVNDMKKHVFVYDDAADALEYLSKKYELLVCSNNSKKFIEAKLDAEGLKKYFDFIFSAPDDFGLGKKNKLMFQKILDKLGAKPDEIVHIGDDHELDYEVPMSVGIKSYHLVRSRVMKDKHVIHSLSELKDIL